MIERSFWRGFPPMLASFWVSALVVQLDMWVVAKLGAGALAGYALVSRVAVADMALTAAIGSISLIVVSRAETVGATRRLLVEIGTCAGLLGVATATIGALVYPLLIDLLASDGPAAKFAHSAIFLYVAATPLEMIATAASFAVHSLGRSDVVLGLKICEAAAKAALNLLFVSWLGFAGCFIAGLIVSLLSVFWVLLVLRRIVVTEGESSPPGFRTSFVRACFVESTRGLGPQLAVFASFALFALAATGSAGTQRLDAYAAVQGLIVLALAPLMAATRFFAMRFSGRAMADLKRLLSALLIEGAPFVIVVAIALALGRDALGTALYGDLGRWWSSFAAALALSLPLRYAGALLRGVLLSRGRIGAVATADGATPWLVALPLIALGIFFDQPMLASLALLAPEGACLFWFWSRRPLSDETSGRFSSELQLS